MEVPVFLHVCQHFFFLVRHSSGCVNTISLWFKFAFPWWLMKRSIFSCFGYSFVKYLCFANCSIGLSHLFLSLMYLKMDTWFTSLASYRPIPCIFFPGHSVYNKHIYPPNLLFHTNTQFYTRDLIYLKGHCTPQHSICLYNILYLIYWWHTGRCSFLLLQTSYCKYWSANIFVYMGESICRINSWVGLLGQRVRTLRFLWFTLLSCSAKSWINWQWHQFGLPCQQRITKLSSLPTH